MTDYTTRPRATSTKQPRPKRARKEEAYRHTKPNKAARGNRGALKQFLDVPVDIMWEVFEHLEPPDLLSLGRTNKAFRQLLLMKTSATLVLWRTCRKNVQGLPECPEDLSEPRYASLMFDRVCQMCGRKNVENIISLARLRLCRKCGLQEFRDYHPSAGIVDYCEISLITPHTLAHDSNAPWMSLPKLHRASFKRLKAQSRSFGTNDTARAAWIQQKRDEYEIRMMTAIQMEEFVVRQAAKVTEARDRLRVNRLEQITERLKIKGVISDRSGLDISILHDHPAVWHATPLTDQSWKKLEPVLTAFINEERKKRGQYEIVFTID